MTPFVKRTTQLSKMTLTAEQTLIANDVFSTLNEAWDAFKLQNGMS